MKVVMFYLPNDYILDNIDEKLDTTFICDSFSNSDSSLAKKYFPNLVEEIDIPEICKSLSVDLVNIICDGIFFRFLMDKCLSNGGSLKDSFYQSFIEIS